MSVAGATVDGIVGEVHPDVLTHLDVRGLGRVIVAELALVGLSGGRLPAERAPAVGRFPNVERDLAIVVAETVPAAKVDALVRVSAGELLRDLACSTSTGGATRRERESLAVRLTFAALDRTLTERGRRGRRSGRCRPASHRGPPPNLRRKVGTGRSGALDQHEGRCPGAPAPAAGAGAAAVIEGCP